jgi:hypothetical protein
MNPNATQRIYPEDETPIDHIPGRCAIHIRRMDRLENRMDRYDEDLKVIKEMRDLIAEINTRLTKLEVCVHAIIWPLGIIAGAALTGVVIAISKLIFK